MDEAYFTGYVVKKDFDLRRLDEYGFNARWCGWSFWMYERILYEDSGDDYKIKGQLMISTETRRLYVRKREDCINWNEKFRNFIKKLLEEDVIEGEKL